jgi:pyridoxine 5-phosphate synthase
VRTLNCVAHAIVDTVATLVAPPERLLPVGEAIFSGLDSAIRRMRALMDEARREAFGEGAA